MQKFVILFVFLFIASLVFTMDLSFMDSAAYISTILEVKVIDPYSDYTDSFKAEVSGSGSVIFSGWFKGHEKTFILTNHHVIEFALMKRENEEQQEEVNNAFIQLFNDKSLAIYKIEGDKRILMDKPDESLYYEVVSARTPTAVLYYFWKRTRKILFQPEVTIEIYSADLDVAIVSLPCTGIPSLSFAEKPVVGETAYIFGAPLGIPFQLTKGIIGQVHLDADTGWVDMVRYDAAQAPGSSGSAIVNEEGKIVAIVRGSYGNMSGTAYEGQHVGIDCRNIKDWLVLTGYSDLIQ